MKEKQVGQQTNLDILNTILAESILKEASKSNLGLLNEIWARSHLKEVQTRAPKPEVK